MKTYLYKNKDNHIYSYKIQCLSGDAVSLTRPLWEEVFFEDSPSFIQYYYKIKAPQNITFVAYTQEQELVSMVHLTPYDIIIDGKQIPSYYIVGVATKESHRHRGLMASLLEEAFSYATAKKIPFVFLMPANPDIYKPFGFSYIYSRPQYSVPDVISPSEVYINYFLRYDINVRYITPSNVTHLSDLFLCKLSSFSNQVLNSRYNYYINRSISYYNQLLQELESQDGGIFLFENSNNILGYFLYVIENKSVFIQELLFSEEFQNIINANKIMSTYLPSVEDVPKPIIMAKNLPSANTDYVNLLSQKNGFINEIV